MEEYLIDKEKESLSRIALARAQSLSIFFSDLVGDLRFIKNLANNNEI